MNTIIAMSVCQFRHKSTEITSILEDASDSQSFEFLSIETSGSEGSWDGYHDTETLALRQLYNGSGAGNAEEAKGQDQRADRLQDCSGSNSRKTFEYKSGDIALTRFVYSFNKFHELNEEFIEEEDLSDREIDLESSPNGKIYTCNYGLGSCSFHFWLNGATYISYEVNIQNWKFDNGLPLP